MSFNMNRSANRSLLVAMALAILCGTLTQSLIAEKFVDVDIQSPFKKHLLRDSVLMTVDGAKIIRLKNGSTLIVGVASTSSSGKLRPEIIRILRVKADRAILELTGKVHVAVEEVIEDESKLIIENQQETMVAIEKYKLLIKSSVKGDIKSLPIVGKWRSQDNSTQFIAVGAVITKAK